MKLANYKYTWLLKLAIICYCQFLFCQLFLESDTIYNYKYTQDTHPSLFIYLLSILIIAPIIEEVIYRGLYKKNKVNILFSSIFLVGSSLMLYNLEITLWWLFPIITVVVLFITIKWEIKYNMSILIIYSSILFTISHFTNASNLSEIIQFGGNFLAGGLLLSWIAVNFNLLKAILFHFTYNTITFILFIFLATPIDIKGTTNQNIEYEITEVSMFSKSNTITRTENKLIVKNANINLILGYIKMPKNKNIYLQSSMMKFDIDIKDNINDLDDHEILYILEKSGVIQYK